MRLDKAPVTVRFKKSVLAATLAGGLFASSAGATTILIHQGVHWDWYTDSAVWADTTTKNNVTALFTYFDGTFDQILSDWGMTAPQNKYFLWVDPNPGGGFATGDIGQISAARGASPSPGIGISFDAFNNPNCGIARFWGYAIGTHENVNLLTGQALTAGWPRDWWADDKSPFPAMTAVNVEAVRAPAGVSACHDATFNDPLYTMMKNIQAHYGWGIFQRMFQTMKNDGIQWTSIDSGNNPSAILTAYVTAYMFIGSGDASITTFLDAQFRAGGIPNYDMNATLAVKSAHDCAFGGGGDRAAFLRGDYTHTCTGGGTGVQFFQDSNFAGAASQVLGAGNYNLAALSAKGVPNDWASSCRVSSGFTVQIFRDDNFLGGTLATFTADKADFTTVSGLNDNMSSCKVTTSTGGGATFFQNINFGGTASQQLGVGTYTLSQLQAKGVPNDWASSARVTAGRTVQMFQNDNFGGTMWTLTGDTANFTTLSPSANDQMSSCKVQ